ncbi:MAG: hypothetical protein EXS08_08730 [Planctomycetes bacterium]|nr:hypothetical protein [Planctomycetota bacterium]
MSETSRTSVGSASSIRTPSERARLFARNSPWLVIALLLHGLAVTILSVAFIRTQRGAAQPPPLTVAVQRDARELPPADIEPPRILLRDHVPALPADSASARELEEGVLPDVAPGRAGEITEETDLELEPGHFNPDPEALRELPSGALGGTPIGVGTSGHRGTKTSAFSSRVLGGGGKGGGGGGQNGADGIQPAGNREIVHSALEWLKRHQDPAGFWDCDGFAAQCTDDTCTGSGSAAHDVGVTGLALLCFLGAGETHLEGRYRTTVKRGLQWLLEVQDEEGCFGPRIGQGFLYDHACAALAMAEAFGMTQAKPFRAAAQNGIAFVLRTQNPYSAWRYAAPGDGDNDTSMTGWMVMALKSAKMAGLTIDEAAFDGALAWIDQVTDPRTGRTGYTELGGPPSRLASLAARFPAENSESMTAVGLLVRIFGGRTPAQDPQLALGAARLAARLPQWSEDGQIDFYYWYYGTLALFQLGGARWERWNEALRAAVIEHQRTDAPSCARGSWDALDAWSTVGGRVYATALNCLSMEVYYRYPRVFGTK